MKVVVDTSILIDVLRSSSAAVEYLLALDESPLCSEITRIELIRGVPSRERVRTERLLGELEWVTVDEAIARRAGDLGRRGGARIPASRPPT